MASVLNKSITSNPVKVVEGSVATPEISVARSNDTIVLTFTGTLWSASNPAGPYQQVEGAESPYTAPDGTGAAFYRSSQ